MATEEEGFEQERGATVLGPATVGHPERIKGALRMSRDTFISLHNWLVNHTQLRASMHVSVEPKPAIFLHIVSRPASQRETMERYFVGSRVASESFHEVLESLLILYPAFVKLPDLNTPLASRISDDLRFYPRFKDCLGALDGTHIAAHTRLEEQPKRSEPQRLFVTERAGCFGALSPDLISVVSVK